VAQRRRRAGRGGRDEVAESDIRIGNGAADGLTLRYARPHPLRIMRGCYADFGGVLASEKIRASLARVRFSFPL